MFSISFVILVHYMIYFSFQYKITFISSCAFFTKTIVYIGLNQTESNIITEITHICNVGCSSIKQTGFPRCYKNAKRCQSEMLQDLRWSLASEADTDYNTQFDPKNLVLSSHTSPEKNNIHPTINTVKFMRMYSVYYREKSRCL